MKKHIYNIRFIGLSKSKAVANLHLTKVLNSNLVLNLCCEIKSPL